MRTAVCLLTLFSATAWTQTQQRIFYFPKPIASTPYKPPMKPLTRLSDLKAKHYGRTNWSELVIDDGNTRAYVISAAPFSSKFASLTPPPSPSTNH